MADGETTGIGDPPPRRVRRRYAVVAAALALLLLALAAAWLSRKPVAAHVIADYLRARGVAARYEVARIGLRTQRLTDVRIGDPARPDLVADWVEVDTSLWFSGASVTAIRVGHARLRARLADGKLSFGAIDRLLPAPSGKPFALPAIRAGIGDARIALATPQGDVALAVAGAGRLDDGFTGTLGMTAARLDLGGCRIDGAAAALQVRIVAARPGLTGPVAVRRAACDGATVTQARADLSVELGTGLDRWTGTARLAVAAGAGPGAQVRALSGPVAFAGSAAATAGTVDLRTGAFSAGIVSARGGALAGKYRYANGGLAFDGTLRATHAALPPPMLAWLDPLRSAGAGTPLGPLVAQAIAALRAAGRSVDLDARGSAIVQGARGQVVLSRLGLASASGVRATFAGAGGIAYRWPGGLRIAGYATLAGGGLPSAQVHLAQDGPGVPLTGRAVIAPYVAGASRLTLSPVDFNVSATGAMRVTTRARLSGPLGAGRVEALALPLSALWDGASRLTVNPGCAPLGFDRLRVSGLDLRRSAVTLCPLDGGLVRLERGAVRGGGTIGPVRLGGTLGASPVDLVGRGAALRLADRRFSVAGLGVRLGTPERMTRLDVATLAGGFTARGAVGTFAGAGGQIGNVPLLLSAAEGRWGVAGGILSLDGALTVADAAADPRFTPLAARGVALTLANGRIAATGTLVEPSRGVTVARVAIAHDLGAGAGHADLTVPGIAFGAHFQPDQLTRLTYGVIANVAGTVNGEGHIRWTPQGVTSDGVFRTAGTDLAAAFGPVTGIAGEIRFTDLLALQSAPGQIATIRTLNPGVPVNDGTIRYQLLPNARIAVEQGRWPFAGGTLTLEPTTLDFGEARERRMTFRVAGMQADQFLQQFDFKNLNATGVFDGALPMVFDARGGRIEGGHLVVRPGGGTIAYVGEVTQKDVGFWGNFAFQALKSLKYRDLDIVMNGPLAGEVITEVRFAGIGQGAGAKRNFLFDRLQRLPIVFNVRIKAPFRQLIDSAQSFYDPRRLIERNLPQLLEEQNKRSAPPAQPVQPSDSRTVP